MTITYPKRLSITVVLGAAIAVLSAWGGANLAFAKRDFEQQAVIVKTEKLEENIIAIRTDIEKLREDFHKMEKSDAGQEADAKTLKETMKRVEEKVDDLLLILSQLPKKQ